MSVYKDKRSPYYQYDFKIKNNRFYGSTGKTSKRDAKRVEESRKRKARIEVNEATALIEGPLTLDIVCDRYWEEVGKFHKAPKTTEKNLDRLIQFLGKDTLLSEIDDDKVTNLVAWRRGHHVKDDPKRPLVSPATVNRSTLEPLRKIFNRAIGNWGARSLKAPDWKKHRLDEPEETPREIKTDDHEKIDAELRADLEPFFRFALASGLRLRECILKWAEIDWRAGIIEKAGKGGLIVRVTLSHDLRQILWPLRGHNPEFVFTYKAQRTRKGLVKGVRYPVTYEGLKSYWRRAKRRAGVKHVRFHDFRHDLGSKLLRETGNLRLVQKALNHRKIETTLRYTHVLDDEVRSGLDQVAKSRKKDRKEIIKSETA